MGRPKRESSYASKALADRLSYLIAVEKERGNTLEKIGEEIGVSKSTLSEWASDNKSPTLGNLLSLSNYFGVTTDWLLGGCSKGNKRANIKAEAIAKYTGLSYESIEVLHYMTRSDPSGTISNAPSINRKSVKFIDRVLKIPYDKIDLTSKEKTDALFTIFYWMDSYVLSDLAERELSNAEMEFTNDEISLAGSAEGQKLYEDRINSAKKYITINDPSAHYTVTIGELYREHILSNVHSLLDYLRTNEREKDKKKK